MNKFSSQNLGSRAQLKLLIKEKIKGSRVRSPPRIKITDRSILQKHYSEPIDRRYSVRRCY